MVQGFVCAFTVFSVLTMSLAVGAVNAGAPDGAALHVYADPESGELVPAPGPDAIGGAAAADAAVDTSDLELVPLPGTPGAVMVDLGVRFAHGVRARANADGSISQQCAPIPETEK